MLYSEVVKQFRLREGVLERKYSKGWRVVEYAKDYKRRYYKVSLFGRSANAHRVIICLKYKRDLGRYEIVDHIDNDSHNNSMDNLQLTNNRWNTIKEYTYKLPQVTPQGKYPSFISISKIGKRGTFGVSLGGYTNAKDHKTVTLAVRAKFIIPEVNPFRTLFEAGRKDEAKKLVQDYAKTIKGCTL